MVNQIRLNDELFSGWFYVILIFLFELEKGAFHNSVFLPLLFVLLCFLCKVVFQCSNDVPNALKPGDLCICGCWWVL